MTSWPLIAAALLAFARFLLGHWALIVAIVAAFVSLSGLSVSIKAAALAVVILSAALWGGKTGFKL